MSVSEKQKQFARMWDKENMRTVSCRMRTEEAEDFRKYCESKNSTPGAELKKYVFDCIEHYYKKMQEK